MSEFLEKVAIAVAVAVLTVAAETISEKRK